jgi:riboflavin biosynthesis pyrimidine reductase
MLSSIDGSLSPSRFTKSPDGTSASWASLYSETHHKLDSQAWIVGRVTMAEISSGQPYPPADVGHPPRPIYRAADAVPAYAVAVDLSGKLHFNGPKVDGDHVIVLLGHDVPDHHLAELIGDGISYIVVPGHEPDFEAALSELRHSFNIERLLLEGGAGINGTFFAAGYVDELSVIIAPALDAREDLRSIVVANGGLASSTRLSLRRCEAIGEGAVHLRYYVHPVNTRPS